MDSTEGPDTVSGDIHAVVDHPVAKTGAVSSTPTQCCDIMILHLNVKYCRPATDPWTAILHVVVGTKFDLPVADGYRVNFVYDAPSMQGSRTTLSRRLGAAP